jgi:hypothetical protein
MANRYLKNKPSQAFLELAERLKNSGSAEKITKDQLVGYFSEPIKITKLTDDAKYLIIRELNNLGLTTIPPISGKTLIEKKAFTQAKILDIKYGETTAPETNPNLARIAEELKSIGKPIEISKADLLGYYSSSIQINRLTADVKKVICRDLKKLGLATIPPLDGKTSAEIQACMAAKSFRFTKTHTPPLSAYVKTSTGAAHELITGRINELPNATLAPTVLTPRDERTDGGYGKLLESGTRGLVLVVDETEYNKHQKPVFKKITGIITWKSYAIGLGKKGDKIELRDTMAMQSHITYASAEEQLTDHYYKITGVMAITDDNGHVIGALNKEEIDAYLTTHHLFPYYQLGIIEAQLRKQIEKSGIANHIIDDTIGGSFGEEMAPVFMEMLTEYAEDILKHINDQKDKAVENALRKKAKEYLKRNKKHKFISLKKLELNHFETIYKKLFKELSLHGNPDTVSKIISNIRERRNELMHFNRDLRFDYQQLFTDSINNLIGLQK